MSAVRDFSRECGAQDVGLAAGFLAKSQDTRPSLHRYSVRQSAFVAMSGKPVQLALRHYVAVSERAGCFLVAFRKFINNQLQLLAIADGVLITAGQCDYAGLTQAAVCSRPVASFVRINRRMASIGISLQPIYCVYKLTHVLRYVLIERTSFFAAPKRAYNVVSPAFQTLMCIVQFTVALALNIRLTPKSTDFAQPSNNFQPLGYIHQPTITVSSAFGRRNSFGVIKPFLCPSEAFKVWTLVSTARNRVTPTIASSAPCGITFRVHASSQSSPRVASVVWPVSTLPAGVRASPLMICHVFIAFSPQAL